MRNKAETLNKFIECYRKDLIQKDANEEYIRKAILISENHLKKYGKRKMSIKELDEFCKV